MADTLKNLSGVYSDRVAFNRHKDVFRAVLQKVDFYHLDRDPGKLLKNHNKLREQIKNNPSRINEFLPDAFGIFSEIVLETFGFRPNPTQLFGGIVLWSGEVLNMRTGEGKTITAAIPAYLQSFTGESVHIITTNDYLAERDHAIANRIFDKLGISCGLITQATPRAARKKEYVKDIIYIANQEIGFDYLRDNLVYSSEDKVLCGFPFAIIDEVDSILIDEARTSMIISSPKEPEEADSVQNILSVVKSLEPEKDFETDMQSKTITLTEAGIYKLIQMFGRDIYKQREDEVVHQVILALYSLIFLKRDRDYIVINDKIVLVDEFTGHLMPDRRLLDGLHQAVEAKEGLSLSNENNISGSITYHGLFKKYRKFTGMSGTAAGAREEFSHIYNLDVVDISPQRETLRTDMSTLFFRIEKEKFNYLINEVKRVHSMDLPILIVGRTIDNIKKLSDCLRMESLVHATLTAKLTEKEFEIIDNAGKPGVITVATNMAGRGADIILDANLRAEGGLVTFGLEPNLSRRVDEQLRGRAGRRGFPGVSRLLASLEDEIFQTFGSDHFWNYAEKLDWPTEGMSSRKLNSYLEEAQLLSESLAAEMRDISVGFDDVMDHHRDFFYTSRDELLMAKNPLLGVIFSMRKIFFKESAHVMPMAIRGAVRSRLMDVLEERHLFYKDRQTTYECMEVVLDAIYYSLMPKKRTPHVYEELESMGVSNTEDIRGNALKALDALWIDYLSQVYYLQNAIFIESAARENPLEQYVQDCDKILHELREDWALNMFIDIYLKLIHPQVDTSPNIDNLK